ncbi:Activated Cdc42 kinase-like [Nymphon striatum]|nr:Activated Cdc42 kinase-like [Nymphon striatum]
MSTSTITSASSSIGGGGGGAGYTINLYEFLSEAELAQYYKGFKDILKVNAVSQLKYVTDEDLQQICMSRPEIRRLKKFFHKYYPQTYLRKIKKVKISDFGLSRALGAGKDYYQTNFNLHLKLPIAWLVKFCKPEQVQAVKDYIEPNISPKKDQLFYRLGDVITVLDNHPVPEATNIWKGVLNSGKSGLFNPANTVAYLGVNMPSTKPNFTRPSSKNSVYSSKRNSSQEDFYKLEWKIKIRPELISGPQDDLKHTGHVGLDGAFFGDVSFLGDRQLPRQIVAPYKPQNDKEQMLTRASSDVSDRAPLLTKLSSSAGGKSGPASELWSDTASDFEKESVISINATNTNDDDAGINIKKLGRGSNGRPAPICLPPDHEYHEISDEENAWHSHTDTDLEEFGSVESPRFESLDFGPSLMDEVFKALDKSENEPNKIDQELLAEQQLNENNNVHNEIQEVLKNRDAVKKKQTVKPISASDQKTLDEAIAMANELASFSLQNIDGSEFDNRNDSPKTPSSPNKRKFSFKFPKNSPKAERRNFTEEAESITHIEESLSEGAKQAYTSLIEKTNASAICTVPISKRKPVPHEVISAPLSPTEDSNPLRMLRNGGSVMRPKVRGNKHNFTQMNNRSLRGTAERANLGTPPPPPPSPPPSQTEDMESSPNKVAAIIQSLNKSSGAQNESQNESNESDNPLPLPPRDRTKILPTYVPRQRKHPLVLAQADSVEKKTNESFEDDDTGVETTQKQNSAETTETVENFVNESNESIKVSTSFRKKTSLTPPPKPPRTSSLDESFEKKIEAQIDSLDEIPDEDAPCPPMQKHNDHVSCEDLLDFALDKPNAKRTQGRSRGIDSDEVRIMIKVLAGGVSAEECLAALNEVEWDVHKAIKYVKLHLLLSANSVSLDNCKQTLINCEWDVQRAASHLFNSNSTGVIEDTTEV